MASTSRLHRSAEIARIDATLAELEPARFELGRQLEAIRTRLRGVERTSRRLHRRRAVLLSEASPPEQRNATIVAGEPLERERLVPPSGSRR